MKPFEYASPRTKESAVQLLGEGSVILAGGTDLISLLKTHVLEPDRVVSIKEVRELKGLEYSSQAGLKVGALVTLDEFGSHPAIREQYPALVQACHGVRSAQIQSIGTVVGDLCQRPRCWYFRSGNGLLAIDDGKSLVTAGDNRYHSILGNSGPAYFVNPSSFAPALIALGARLKILGAQGEREVAVADFFQIPQSEGQKEYRLGPQELVTEIVVPPADGAKSATYEVREKEALDWPLAAASVALKMGGDQVSSAQVVLGHVAPVPWQSEAAARALVGKPVNAQSAAAAGDAAVADARPLSQNQYKVQLTRVAVKRAILRAAGMEVG